MSNPLKKEVQSLFTLSSLEKNRIETTHADPRNISSFKELEAIIQHSLKKPNLVRTQTPSGSQLVAPRLETRGFQDEALLKKLLQYRAQIPTVGKITSSRIIRKAET